MYLLAGPLNQQANPGKEQVAVLLQLTENRSYRCCSNQDKTSALVCEVYHQTRLVSERATG